MQVQEGKGWRLAQDGSRQPFCVLIAGDGWASELSPAEARALAEGSRRLLEQHASLAAALMPEEQLCLELELELQLAAGSLWLELEGDRQLWGLRFVLNPGGQARALEGSWPAPTAMAVVAALEQLAAGL